MMTVMLMIMMIMMTVIVMTVRAAARVSQLIWMNCAKILRETTGLKKTITSSLQLCNYK